jgi:hypothetical protein
MNEVREEAIQGVLASLQQQRMKLLEGERKCSFECDSILLGSLEKQMYSKNLLLPEPTAPFLRLDYNSLVNTVHKFVIPPLYSKSGHYGDYHEHKCNPPHKYFQIRPILGDYSLKDPSSISLTEYRIGGLSLDLYKSK